MFTTRTQNWNVMRIIRLVMGGYALVEAFRGNEPLLGMLGLVLVGMALFNAGCGAQGCGVPIRKSTAQDHDDVEYEEIRSK